MTTAALLLVALLGRHGAEQVAARRPTLVATVEPASESWRLGVTSEGDATYAAIIGRPVGASASFRSNRGVTDIYYIFPAPGRARVVQAAAFHILRRSGTYSGVANLTLEVRAFDGSLQRTVASAPLDLQAAPTGVWTDLALDANPANLTIAPGEYLAFRFTLDGASGGDLDVRPVFEAVIE